MRVLILNRRDIGNPQGGGAEVYTHEIAKGLTAGGHKVTGISCAFSGGMKKEVIDGVVYLRKGSELTVHLKGFLHAFRRRRDYDLIIDEYNGIGFFTFMLKNSMVLIHQMYREFWFRELGVFGVLPYLMEPLILWCYRNKPVVTVSESTRDDLAGLGFKNVRVVMNALSTPTAESLPVKEDAPTLIFVGRMRSTKRPEDAVGIFAKVKQRLPSARLWMVGRGPDEEKVRRAASGLDDVTFFGWVEEERKFELLSRAHVLLVPSVREGFGINVIEAASQGTPAVGYDVHGLRDSIRDGETGLLARDADDASVKVLRMLSDEDAYRSMALRCLEYARGFVWQNRVREFHEVLEDFNFLK